MATKIRSSFLSATAPYLDLIRFSKPGGTLLIFLPHAYGLTMAAFAQNMALPEYLYWLVTFSVWSFVARSLGCTINDMCDYEFDRKVERTKDRPLASGKISLRAAGIFLCIQVIFYFAIMWTSDNILFYYRILCFPLMFLYPLMKRFTYTPQAWLGIAMNWGAVLGWTTVYGNLNLNVMVPLLGGLWAWTMFYDTIYACQDRKDDVNIGIGSTALTLGSALVPFLVVCAAMFVSLLAIAIRANGHGLIFTALTVGGAATEMTWQLWTIDPYDPATCKGNLARNAYVGCVLWAGMTAEYLVSTL